MSGQTDIHNNITGTIDHFDNQISCNNISCNNNQIGGNGYENALKGIFSTIETIIDQLKNQKTSKAEKEKKSIEVFCLKNHMLLNHPWIYLKNRKRFHDFTQKLRKTDNYAINDHYRTFFHNQLDNYFYLRNKGPVRYISKFFNKSNYAYTHK